MSPDGRPGTRPRSRPRAGLGLRGGITAFWVDTLERLTCSRQRGSSGTTVTHIRERFSLSANELGV